MAEYSLLWKYHIYSFVCWWTHHLDIMNNAVITLVSICLSLFNSFGYLPRVELLGLFNFLRNFLFSTAAVPFYIPISKVCFLIFSTSLATLTFSVFLGFVSDFTHSTECWMVISLWFGLYLANELMMSIFSCALLSVCLYIFFRERSFQVLCLLKIFVVELWEFLKYILDIKPFQLQIVFSLLDNALCTKVLNF